MPTAPAKSSIPQLTSLMATRNANKNTHPGQVIKDSTQKRRSPEEMKKIRAEEALAKAQKERERSKQISNVAEIEDRLRKEDIERRASSRRVTGQPAFSPTDMDRAVTVTGKDDGKL